MSRRTELILDLADYCRAAWKLVSLLAVRESTWPITTIGQAGKGEDQVQKHATALEGSSATQVRIVLGSSRWDVASNTRVETMFYDQSPLKKGYMQRLGLVTELPNARLSQPRCSNNHRCLPLAGAPPLTGCITAQRYLLGYTKHKVQLQLQ